MRNKIDYGIDLGTTNSAIARMENGHPVIKKADMMDTIPSCVSINRKQSILVGLPAFNTLKNDSAIALKRFDKNKASTFIEFKRTMGTSTPYESSNMGKEFVSSELSSELLLSLEVSSGVSPELPESEAAVFCAGVSACDEPALF